MEVSLRLTTLEWSQKASVAWQLVEGSQRAQGFYSSPQSVGCNSLLSVIWVSHQWGLLFLNGPLEPLVFIFLLYRGNKIIE